MSVRVCVHPVMRDSVSISRYGSASSLISNGPVSPTMHISASAVAAISRRDANALASEIYQPAPKQSDGMASRATPSENRTCTLPEIPNSPSSRSVISSDSPFLLQMRNVCERCNNNVSSVGSSQYPTSRNSMFPNFRALQRLALSAKARTSLNQNPTRSSSPYHGSRDLNQNGSTLPDLGKSRTPILSNANGQPRMWGKELQRRRSVGDGQTPAGFSSLASFPGNRHGGTDSQKLCKSPDEMLHVYVADDSVSSKNHKKSAKRKKRKTRTKSRAQYSQKHPQDAKQKMPPDKKGPLEDSSLGTLLRAMPVVVEPKKIEIYSSRYSKCNMETAKTNQNSSSDEKGANNPNLHSPRKDSSQGFAGNKSGTLDCDTVIYASRVSPRIPGLGGLGVGHRKREDMSRMTRVYLSDKQSGNLRECGLILPCAPPGTPTPVMLESYQYVPSMMDLRSQRAVRDRLSGMEQKAKKKQQQQREEAKKTEQQLQRDQAVAWKQRQRLEIYALNKIMTDFEEKNFWEFMKTMSGKTH